MNMQCHACGKKFRSMSAEAKHRHNFPALCTRNRTFERFTAQCEIDALKEQLTTLTYQMGEVFGTYDEWVSMPCKSLEDRMRNAILRARQELAKSDKTRHNK